MALMMDWGKKGENRREEGSKKGRVNGERGREWRSRKAKKKKKKKGQGKHFFKFNIAIY